MADEKPLMAKPGIKVLSPLGGTGIYVRAKFPEGGWGNVDIRDLDAESLLRWLRSRGGNNQLAENVVGILLGHGHLVKE